MDAIELEHELSEADRCARSSDSLGLAQHAARALELARTAGDPVSLIRALGKTSLSALWAGALEDFRRATGELLALAENPAHQRSVSRSATDRTVVWAYFARGEVLLGLAPTTFEDSQREVDRAEEYLQASGHPEWRGGIACLRARFALADPSLQQERESLGRLQPSGSKDTSRALAPFVDRLHAHRKEATDRAISFLEEAVRSGADQPDLPFFGAWRARSLLAELRWERGEFDSADATYQALGEDARLSVDQRAAATLRRAWFALEREDPRAALDLAARSAEMVREGSPRILEEVLELRASACLRRLAYDEVDAAIAAWLAHARRSSLLDPDKLFRAADMQLATGSPEKARALYDEVELWLAEPRDPPLADEHVNGVRAALETRRSVLEDIESSR